MATLGASLLTLSDIAKMKDPQGKIAMVAELLDQTNKVVTDIPWKEGNLDTGHQTVQRTSLPTPTWVGVNGSVTPTVATVAQSVEACGIMQALVEVEKLLAEVGGNPKAVLAEQIQPHIEGMGQEFTGTLFYGNSATAVKEFNGLAVRYAATSGNTGQNIVLGGGAGADNSSIWLVGWGLNKVYGIYPKGTVAGLKSEYVGEETAEVATGLGTARSRVYRHWFTWKCGIALEDWRYVVRIPNIDISNLVAKSSAADLFDLMIKATHRIPDLDACKPVFYMNRTVFQMLDIQSRDDVQTGGQLKYEEVGGKRLMSFRGIPVRICDQLTEAEAVVS